MSRVKVYLEGAEAIGETTVRLKLKGENIRNPGAVAEIINTLRDWSHRSIGWWDVVIVIAKLKKGGKI